MTVRQKMMVKEDAILKAKRIQIKWKQRDDLAKRRERLTKKIAKMKKQV
jgi:hypothetical protein